MKASEGAQNAASPVSAQQQLLLAHMDEGFAACEMLYDAAGAPSDYRFLEVNAAFEQQTGLHAAAILRKTALELFPDVERTWIERFGKVCTSGISERFENFNHNTARYYESFAYSPEPTRFFLLIRDITARKQAEQAIAQSENRLRLALEVGKMATWNANYVTGEYLWDEATIRLLGYQPGVQASREAWARRVHPEDLPHVEAKMHAACRLDGHFSAEYRIFSQRDEIRWVEARGRIESDHDGKMLGSYGVMVDITGRQRDRQRLQESADQLRLALAVSHSGYFDRDLQRSIIRWSDEMAHLYGFDPGYFTLSGEQWRKCVLPADLPATEAQIEQAMRTGELRCEFRIVRQNDRQIRWIGSRGKVLYDPQGKPLRLVGINTDITETKRVEEVLRLTSQRFELALRNSPIVVFNQNLDLRYTWIYNPALGYQPEAVLGKRDLDIFERGEDAAITERIKRNVIRSGLSQRHDVIVRSKGVDRCYDLMVDPQRDASGAIIGVTCAAIDRTERKQNEQALYSQRQLTETVLEQIPCCVAFVSGPNLTIQLANSACHALAPGRKIIGCTLAEAWPEVPGFAELCRSVLSSRQPCSAIDRPVTIARSPGAPADLRYFTWTIHPVNLPASHHDDGSEDQPGLLISGWETTQRKLAEEALLRNEKLASVGRIATSIAHQINNPLTSATNLLYLAANSPDLPHSAREYLQAAQAELNRVAHVARQSLGFYRESADPVPTRLGDLLQSTIDLLQARIARKQASVTIHHDRQIEVTAVPGELRQLISNLLANALDAIEPGGAVHIRVSSSADYRTGAPRARITIADNGCGIPPQARSHIFEPFFTTKGVAGTGLGLWVGKQLLDKNHGRIRMRSRTLHPSRGTTFSVTLPLTP